MDKQNLLPNLQEVSWDDVRSQVMLISPDVGPAIEDIYSNKEYKIYKATYPYGSHIVNNGGQFQMPSDNGDAPKPTADLMGENGFPLNILLKGYVESYSEKNFYRVTNSNIHESGELLELHETLGPTLDQQTKPFRKIIAGARTPYMMFNNLDSQLFDELKNKFDLKMSKPNSQNEYRLFFNRLINSSNNKSRAELLLFSASWLNEVDSDSWKLFRLALLDKAWLSRQYARNADIVGAIWRRFRVNLKNIHATDAEIKIVRHIVECCLGEASCHVKADSCIESPFVGLNQIFREYGNKDYEPIILIPRNINKVATKEAYLPLDFSDRNIIVTNKKADIKMRLEKIEILLNSFIEQIRTDELPLDDTPFYRLLDIDYHFYPEENLKKLLEDESFCSPRARRSMENFEEAVLIDGIVRFKIINTENKNML